MSIHAYITHGILKEYEKNIKVIKSLLIIFFVSAALLFPFLEGFLLCVFHLQRRYFMLQKSSCLPHLHCKGEAKKKECGRQKEGRSAGDSFRRFSRRILSATPGARIRIRTGVVAGSADFEYAGALGNGKFAAVGLATALPSVIIPCTTHRRLYSFSESVTLLSLRSPYISVPRRCSSCCFKPCVSPAVVPPGAKVALEQPSSSTSLAISLVSLTRSTCRSSYLFK